MKKKSPRGVPDFSRQAARPKDGAQPDAATPARTAKQKAAPTPSFKPQTGTAKLGQRGK